MPSDAMIEAEFAAETGPWKVFYVKSNAAEVQQLVVPWFIAMYRLSYAKLDVIKQVMATATNLGLIECVQTAVEAFPVALNDVAKRVKAAVGLYFDFLGYPCSATSDSKTTDSSFNKPNIDIARNPHLSGLSRPGVPPIAWETKERHSALVLTVPSRRRDRMFLKFLSMSLVYTCVYLFILLSFHIYENWYILVYTGTTF
jgi:hypothetical protein